MDNVITLAIVGSGGAGVIVTGEMCLQAVAQAGGFGHLRKSFGPQIRGGESAAILTLSSAPLANIGEFCQCLFVLDWKNFNRFKDEIRLDDQPLIIVDNKAGECPESLSFVKDSMLTVPFTEIAKANDSEKINGVFLGLIGYLLGLNEKYFRSSIKQRFSKKHTEFTELALSNLNSGYRYGREKEITKKPLLLSGSTDAKSQWMLTGNQGLAYGALKAGIRFGAAYPITPASDLLEWIAGNIESLDGHIVQAEDELSAINMAIGGAFGGVPAMTATSGPGLSLMSEALGLAITSETPVVVMNVMRGGPSTGIPTKSEQSDFNLAVFGTHGDAPHVVIAPNSIGDTVMTGGWAVALAEALQTVVIVLSDQRIGQSVEVLPKPKAFQGSVSRLVRECDDNGEFFRYLDTSNGISAMAIPGDPDGIYTAEGLEHTQKGRPSPSNEDHCLQLDKRQRKLQLFDFGDNAVVLHSNRVEKSNSQDKEACLIVCWGSVTAAARAALVDLASKGIDVDVLSLRLLSPLPITQIMARLERVKVGFVVEQNHQGQCYRYIRSFIESPVPLHSIARPGPVSISSAEISGYVMSRYWDGTNAN